MNPVLYRTALAVFLPMLVWGDAATTVGEVAITPRGLQQNIQFNNTGLDCGSRQRAFVPKIHKKTTYKIAVHAIRGLDKAQEEYNEIFSNYLTQTAGQRFEPPIAFEMVPVGFQDLFTKVIDEQSVDFFYANPGIYSCVGVEVGAQALTTIVSRLDVRGSTYDLDVYGGVIFTRAGNDRVNSINDLVGKVIAANDISDLMGAQMQLYTMELNGLSFVMDPKQVVFTGSQGAVVQGVLNGDFDVGFVRTDQIEQTIDERTGNFIDPDVFKILEPKIFVLDNGELFPFLHSTDVYPEWPVAALPHVPPDISEEVQEALLAVAAHAETGDIMSRLQKWEPKRCDTTQTIAQIASKATVDGKFAGFHTSKSYFPVRTMQESAGFLLRDPLTSAWKCTRADSVYDSIECPEGHYKKPLAEYEQSCQNVGLQCGEGFDCYCQPCVKAFEVDVFPLTSNVTVEELLDSQKTGCEKMSLCGEVEQTKTVTFMIIDNKQRPNADVHVLMHLDNSEVELDTFRVGEYSWEFQWSENFVGVGIMEIFINEEQIPESPIRVQVVERDCEVDYPSQRRTNSGNGDCVCGSGTWDMQGKCVNASIMAAVFSIVAVFVLLAGAIMFMRYKNKKNDEMWHINVDELLLDDPPEVIGQGSFGVVVQAEYRGTKVAIKRVSRAHGTRHSRKGSRHSRSRSRDGSKGKKKRENKRRQEHSPTPTPEGSDPSADPTLSVSNLNAHSEAEDFEDEDPEAGSVQSGVTDEMQSVELLEDTNPQAGAALASISDSKKRGAADTAFSFGFLATDFGGGNQNQKLTGWLPWMKKDNYYQNRFKETILGEGGSGSVDRSRSKTMFERACYCFSSAARDEEEFIAEMRILSRLRHPCITTVMGAVISNSHDPMLVMEYMEYGSLYDLLRNESMHLSGDVILQITRDTAQGLRYLHSSKPPITHGDLKGRNILIDSRFRAKLCDFGMATKNKNLITGTPYWLAPEYLRAQVPYNPACDMYSIGIILFEIYARQNPYEGENFRDVLRKVCDKRVNKRPHVPATCPPKMVELMKRCWNSDPRVRPEAKDLDVALMDMNSNDAEPMVGDQSSQNLRQERRTGDMLYELFPKHIADALKAGQKVEPEQHDLVTVIFSDIVHFQDISRDLAPMKVSNMLDRLYLAFDKIARKHGVFKVETIGDAYMGVTNLEKSQQNTHVKQAASFAVEMVLEAGQILIDEEDPTRGYIKIRVGFHSGPVVSNVIGSLNPRYGLFGDTVNTASRMESNSRASRILCSEKSAKLLESQAPEIPVTKRGKIAVKGKGDMLVFWVGDRIIINSVKKRKTSISAVLSKTPANVEEKQAAFGDNKGESNLSGSSSDLVAKKKAHDAVVDTVVDTLYGFLEKIVLAREQRAFVQQAMGSLARAEVELEKRNASKIVIKEMTEALLLPVFNEVNRGESRKTAIHPKVKAQLRAYVEEISTMYRTVPFHNFKHAAHVLKSAATMMERCSTSNGASFEVVSTAEAKEMHERSYGICSDKIMQFGCVFSALIHDVDHTGLTNAELVNMGSALASAYQDRSVAEQNSLNLGWDVLMESKYRDLRACIYTNEMELKHFRKVLVNAIMATDIADKELKTMRENRWSQAFVDSSEGNAKDKQMASDRRASMVLEYILQASDVGHTMQHWETYLAFNRRLFTERYLAWKNGHSGDNAKDPSQGWYGGEIWFFDNYIIPLANRLKSSGALGVTAEEYVNNAQENRRMWEEAGAGIVQEMLGACIEKYNRGGEGPNKSGDVDYISDDEVFSSQLSDC